MSSIKRIDILFFAYLLFSTLFLILDGDAAYQVDLMIVHAIIAMFIIGLIILNSKISHPFIKLLRDIYPLILSGYFYSETVFYNKFFFSNLDPLLEKIEVAVFGMQPSLEFAIYFSNRLFSELMYFSYFSFFLIILGFTLYMYFKKRDDFNKANFQLSASLYFFYIIFIIFPSAGPQFYFPSPQNSLPEAYVFDEIIHFIQRNAEQPTGAFPSSHVGVSIIILMISRKIAPVFFKVAWPFVALIILSTVYIKAHYAIDVLGGLLIAPFILYLSNILYRFPAKGLKS